MRFAPVKFNNVDVRPNEPRLSLCDRKSVRCHYFSRSSQLASAALLFILILKPAELFTVLFCSLSENDFCASSPR